MWIQIPVPTLLHHDLHDRRLGTSHLLQTGMPGVSLASIRSRLTASQRANIERTLGSYHRQISSLAGPKFGAPQAVFAGSGSDTWRECFFQMLESILRDAEDALVNLPYDSIRYYMQRHGHLLNEVNEARMVFLDISNEANVLIHERTKQVSGLVDQSDVVLGDPFMAKAFVRPTAAFLEGYGSRPSQTQGETVRQLLYVTHMYHIINHAADLT
jgi:hypothetical protein